MANKAISELPQALNVNNQDLFVLEQSGIAKKLPAETFITEQGIIDALAEALDGHGGIQSVTLSSVSGRIRTYRITFTDQSATTFQVYDGTSIDRISRTSSSGLDDVYTIFLSDGTTTFFTVHNGADGTVSEAMLNDALKDKAPVITETTESSAIANFTDGADDMPVTSLVAEIEPVQDLHGYNNPWPKDGGANLLDLDKASYNPLAYGLTVARDGGGVRITGTATQGGNLAFNLITNYSDATLGGKGYVLQVFDVTTGYTIGNVWGFRTESERAFAISLTGITEGQVVNCFMKLSVAATSQTSWSPYSNICPISGWTGCKVTRTGKNLADASTSIRTYVYRATTRPIEGNNGLYLSGANGGSDVQSLTVNSWAQTVTKFSFQAVNDINVSLSGKVVNYTENCNGYVCLGYIKDGVFTRLTPLVFFDSLGVTSIQINNKMIPKGAYLALQTTPAAKATAVTLTQYAEFRDIQVEIGSTTTAYEEYTEPTTVSVDWTSEAGTVYGGTIDVATGLLTVDRAYALLNDASQWREVSGNPKYRYSTEFADRKKYNNSYDGLSACSYIQINASEYTNTGRWVSSSSNNFGIESSGLTLAQIQQDATDGEIAIVYELATPQVYQLTGQQLMTLLGNNSVWADVGNVSVTYPADTKMFIEKLTQPTEDDMTANQAITSGKFFMVGNNLYLATAAIASGATIIEGTNATRLSLADALNRLS